MTASSSRRWFGLVFISLGVALIIVDSTIVNVAIPAIVDDIGLTSTQVQWVQEAYTLVFAALLLLFGSLADKFGRRRMMLLGIVIFTVASVLAGLAPDGDLLILARLIQGVGGAMVLPTTLSLINATFRGRERGIAFAVWGSTIGGMVAVGPLLGGWLTTAFSWRWAFGINVPLGILIFIGVLLTVAESREEKYGKIDFLGAALSVLVFGPLVFGLIEGRTYGWWLTDKPMEIGAFTWPFALSPVPVAFAISLLALVGFVAWELHRKRSGKSVLLEFSLFRISSFRNGNIAAMLISLGEFGIILTLPLWLQFVLGFDALQTGFLLLALAIGSFMASGFAGATSGRISPVTIVRVGLVAEIIGVGAVGLIIGPDAVWGWLIPALFVYGFGVGLATAQLTGVILQDVPVEMSGQGSGTQSTARQVGSALGVAILGTVLFTSTAGILTSQLEEQNLPADQIDQVVSAVVDSAGGAIAGLEANPQTADIADAAKAAFSDGTRLSAFAATGFLVIGLFATFSLGGAHRTKEQQDADARAAGEAALSDGASGTTDPPPASSNLLNKDNELS